MPTTLLIVKNQGQPSNWSHYRNGSANALHFSAFRISIEAGEFQIEKINAGKLEKVLWSNVTVRDDSSGTMGTPVTPTSPIDLANILEGLGYPAYSFTGAQTLQSVTSAGATTTEDITIGEKLEFGAGGTILDDGGQMQINHQYGMTMNAGTGLNINSFTTQDGSSADQNTNFVAKVVAYDSASRGLTGEQDFTPNITDLDFTQKKYVDDAIAGITPGGSLTIVPSTNITVDDTDPANPIVASQTNAAGDGTAITDGLVEHENLLANSLTAVADISGRDLIASRHALIDGNVVAVGTVSGSNLSGTNTGDNAVNTTSNSYADAKVADAINDGTTTVAPSQNAVFDALALKAPLASPALTGSPTAPTATAGTNTTQLATTAFVKTELDNRPIVLLNDTATSSSITGVTVNTIITSYLVPANTFAIGDFIEMMFEGNKTGTAAGAAFSIYMNSSASLTGATKIAGFASGATARNYITLRHITFKSGTSFQILNYSVNNAFDLGADTSVHSTITYDVTQPYYIMACVNPASAADSFVQSRLTFIKVKVKNTF